MKSWIVDTIFIIGIGMLGAGLWLLDFRACLIIMGSFFIALALLPYLRGSK